MTYYLHHLLMHPVALAVLSLAVLAPCWKIAGRPGVRERPSNPGLVAAGAAVLAYLGFIGWYAHGVRFVDFSEPLTICVAWAYLHGQPIYHAADAAARYTLAYGPLAYLVEAAWLRLTGPVLDWAKAPAVLASALSVALMAAVAARHLGWKRSLPATALVCIVLPHFNNAAFWTRPDPFLLLAASAGAFAAETLPAGAGVVLFGLALGLAPLSKLFGFIYFLPFVPVIWRRWGVAALFLAGLLSLAVFAFPFLGLPRVSFANHLYWTSMARRQGFDWGMLRFCVEYAIFYLTPLVLLGLLAKLQVTFLEWGCLLAALAVATVLGAKAGGSWHYLMPMAPAFVAIATRPVLAHPPAWLAPVWGAFIVASLLLDAGQARTIGQILSDQKNARAEERELMGIIHEHPGASMAMGSEGCDLHDPTTRVYLRPILLFAGSPLGLDIAGIVDMTHEGLSVPAGTLEIFDRGEYACWIFPAGQQPFLTYLYPPPIRSHFLAHYALLRHGQYYDVWSYRGEGGAANHTGG